MREDNPQPWRHRRCSKATSGGAGNEAFGAAWEGHRRLDIWFQMCYSMVARGVRGDDCPATLYLLCDAWFGMVWFGMACIGTPRALLCLGIVCMGIGSLWPSHPGQATPEPLPSDWLTGKRAEIELGEGFQGTFGFPADREMNSSWRTRTELGDGFSQSDPRTK